MTLGGTTFNSGELLISLKKDDGSVGAPGYSVATGKIDIFRLQVLSTTEARADLILDGSDLGLSDSIKGLTFHESQTIPGTVSSLSPIQDSYIQLKAPTTNSGTSGSMTIDREASDLQRALVQFDLSTIPAGATIQRATLKLEATAIGGQLTIEAYRILEPWSEGSTTWNESSSGTNWSTPGAAFNPTALDSILTDTIGQHSFDITTTAQDWLDGTEQNHGILIGSPEGGGNRTVTYDSREGTVAPSLEIIYTEPANTAPEISSNGGGATAGVNVAENTTLVTTVTATDGDGDTLNYSISGGLDAARFNIDSATGELTFTAAPDFENPADNGVDNVYNVSVDVDDGNGATDSQEISVTVTPVNEAPTFNVGTGIETNHSSSVSDTASDLLLQDDGKLILVGTSNDGAGPRISLSRHLEDGSLDPGFGTDGRVTTAINSSESVQAGTLQSDGSIVVVGVTNGATGESAITRYLSDGNLDNGFGTNGHVVLDLSATSGEYLYDVVVQADGRILATGYANAGDEVMTVVRLNADGSLDPSFNGSGILTLDLVAGNDRANAILVQDDGKILIGGQAGSFSAGDLAVLRLNADGSFDTSFNGTGVFTMDVSTVASGGSYTNSDSAMALAVDDRGRIVIGGNTSLANSESLAMRLNSNGTLDTSFNGTGYHVISAGVPYEGIKDLALQPDHRIVLVGSAYTSSGINDVSVLRLNDDGSLDTSFDGDGKVRQPIGTATDEASAVVIGHDGDIIVAGRTDDGQVGTHIMRFTNSGQLDARFAPVNTLDGNPTFSEDGAAVVLDADVQVVDEELSMIDNFANASLIVVRDSGANTQDIFSFVDGNGITRSGNNLLKNGQVIATFTQSTPGALLIVFTDADGQTPTQIDVDNILRQIAYSNSSDTPPPSVQLDWTFDDSNTGSQGSGGPLTCNGSTMVNITGVNDPPVFDLDADNSSGGATGYHLASFAEGSSPVAVIDSDVSITDSDNTTMSGVGMIGDFTGSVDASDEIYAIGGEQLIIGTPKTVVVAQGGTDFQLDFSDGSSLSISVDSGTGAIADFEALLATMTYDHTGTEPTAGIRSFSFIVTNADGEMSNTVVSTINVTSVNDAPTITSNGGGDAADIYVAENTTSITTVIATDPDLGTPTFSKTGGADQAQFSINTGSGVLTFAMPPDFESPADADSNGVYEVQVSAADGNGGSDAQLILVTVANVNEQPTAIAISTSGIDENTDTSGGYSVGSLTTTDQDSGDTAAYSIQGGSDAALFTIGGDQLILTHGVLDFEAQAGYEVTVRVTDSGGLTFDQNFSIAVNNLNEAPGFTSIPVTVATEDALYSYTITTTDPDSTASVTITAATLPTWLTLTDHSNGTANLSGTPDNGQVGDHNVSMQVSDGSLSDTQNFTLTVTNTNDAPLISEGETISVAMDEDASPTPFELILNATDPDGDILNWSISSPASNGVATANGTGLSMPIGYTPAADFNGDDSFDVQVSDGTASSTITVEVTVSPQPDGILIVDTTSDLADGNTDSIETLFNDRGTDNRISLREAIIATNNTANGGSPDEILFSISGSGTHTINPASPLPSLTDPVIIDATSDDSFAANGNRPAIVLDGNNLSGDGLVLASTAGGSTIRGLVIRDFDGNGIVIQAGSDSNMIASNYIGGLTATGTDAGATEANTGTGIEVKNASGNMIGGSATTDRNVISGNQNRGISLWGSSAINNVVIGNYIGTNAAGTGEVGNSDDGIRISGGASSNTIGGAGVGEANLISGNGKDGIALNTLGVPTNNNVIHGNSIGTNHDGTAAITNARHGVVIYGGVQGTQIGGGNAGEGNLISGNGSYGIVIDGNGDATTINNTIAGNYIGTDVSGSSAIANTSGGVRLFNAASDNLIGGGNLSSHLQYHRRQR